MMIENTVPIRYSRRLCAYHGGQRAVPATCDLHLECWQVQGKHEFYIHEKILEGIWV